MINVMAICAGVGGLELGVQLGSGGATRAVCYVEREAYAAGVLATRMEDGALDQAPIWSDLATFDARPWRGSVDIITAGYPCQPFSLAGKRLGASDPRHLWPHVARAVSECAPGLVFCENVAAHLRLGFDVVVRDMEAMGYRVAATLHTASEHGAWHKRERLFWCAVATYPDGNGEHAVAVDAKVAGEPRGAAATDPDGAQLRDQSRGGCGACGPGAAQPREYGDIGPVADPDGAGREQRPRSVADATGRPEPADGRRADPDGAGLERQRSEHELQQPSHAPQAPRFRGWESEPELGRVANGVAHRVDRLRAIGNGVVPQVAANALLELARALQ